MFTSTCFDSKESSSGYVRTVYVITAAQGFGENVWANDIERPVVRHSRDNITRGCFRRVTLCALRVARRV